MKLFFPTITVVLAAVCGAATAQANDTAYLCEVACGKGSAIVKIRTELDLRLFANCTSTSTLLVERHKYLLNNKEGSTARVTTSVKLVGADKSAIVSHTAHNDAGEIEELHYLKDGVSLECKITDPKKPNFAQKALLTMERKPALAESKKVEDETKKVEALAAPVSQASTTVPAGCYYGSATSGCLPCPVGYVQNGYVCSLPSTGYYNVGNAATNCQVKNYNGYLYYYSCVNAPTSQSPK